MGNWLASQMNMKSLSASKQFALLAFAGFLLATSFCVLAVKLVTPLNCDISALITACHELWLHENNSS